MVSRATTEFDRVRAPALSISYCISCIQLLLCSRSTFSISIPGSTRLLYSVAVLVFSFCMPLRSVLLRFSVLIMQYIRITLPCCFPLIWRMILKIKSLSNSLDKLCLSVSPAGGYYTCAFFIRIVSFCRHYKNKKKKVSAPIRRRYFYHHLFIYFLYSSSLSVHIFISGGVYILPGINCQPTHISHM